jgi:hypothetical protein
MNGFFFGIIPHLLSTFNNLSECEVSMLNLCENYQRRNDTKQRKHWGLIFKLSMFWAWKKSCQLQVSISRILHIWGFNLGSIVKREPSPSPMNMANLVALKTLVFRNHNLESKTQGNPWAFQESSACFYNWEMRTLTRMNKGVIEDYYHMTTMDENVN